MKRFLAVLLIGAIIIGSVFAVFNTARLNLSVSLSETAENTGIKVLLGDKSEEVNTLSKFEETFFKSTSSISIDYPISLIEENLIEYFTVLVRRGSSSFLDVELNAEPLQSSSNLSHLNYSVSAIKEERDKTIDVSYTAVGSINYRAKNTTLGNSIIRDATIFKLIINRDINKPIDDYNAVLIFTIETL